MSEDREAQLLRMIAERDEALARFEEKNTALETEVRFLREKIDALVRRVFGASSEKLDASQLELLPGKDPAPAGDAAGDRQEQAAPFPCSERRERKSRRLPEHLPVEEIEIVPLEVEAEPEAWVRIGAEVREQLDYRPARYLRQRTIRPKFVRKDDRSLPPVTAPLEPQLADKLLATPAMIAHVVVGKYADHLPIYRQADILARRHRIELGTTTMEGWVHLAAGSLRMVYEVMWDQLIAAAYLQCDETPIQYIEPGHGRTRTGYFWTAQQPRGPTIYHWFPSRAADCLSELLPPDWSGILQTDGYAAYPAYARSRPITLCACWAHVRRKFHTALQNHRRVGPVLAWIGQLYQIERTLRDAGACDRRRAEVRQDQARPIMEQIHHWLLDHGAAFLPKSDAGKAVAYTLALWPQLQVYLEHGEVEIDNNLVENAIRPTAVGKKNWLFIGAEGAGQNSAILFTLIQECRRLEINAQDYLTLALNRIPTATNHNVGQLTPQALAPQLRASLPDSAVRAA